MLGHRAHDLQFDAPDLALRHRGRQDFAGDLAPAHREVAGDVGDRRPTDTCARVVPADLAASRMSSTVKTVARLMGEVDPADERDPVVDDDRLLVVAVQGALLLIEGAADLCSTTKLLAHL